MSTPRRPDVLLFGLLLVCSTMALAAATDNAESEPPEDPETDGWGVRVDATHESLSSRVDATARWFDGFFGDERAELEANFSYLRLTPGVVWDADDQLNTRVRIRGKLDLPGSKNRLSLFIAGDDDDNFAGFTNVDDGDAFGTRSTGDDAAVGLQFVARNSRRYHSSFNATITSGMHGELSFRLRRRFMPRERTDGFVWSNYQVESLCRFRGQANHALGHERLLRLTARAETYEDIDGWKWSTAITHYKRLESRAVLGWELGYTGNTDPETDSRNLTFGPIYRRNVLRPWIFASARPFVSRRDDATSGKRWVHGVKAGWGLR